MNPARRIKPDMSELYAVNAKHTKNKNMTKRNTITKQNKHNKKECA